MPGFSGMGQVLLEKCDVESQFLRNAGATRITATTRAREGFNPDL
jgi:hypothetical protein